MQKKVHLGLNMREYEWDDQGLKILVVSHYRDLGSHLCLDNTMAATTSTKRMKRATQMVKRLRWVNLLQEEKAKVVQSNVLPAALYGIEMGRTNQSAIENLSAAIVDVLGPRSVRRSRMGVYEALPGNSDLDPDVHQVLRRTMLLRRMAAKHGKVKTLIDEMFREEKRSW